MYKKYREYLQIQKSRTFDIRNSGCSPARLEYASGEIE